LLDVQAALAALLFLPRRPKWPEGLLGEMLTIGSGRRCIVADFGGALTDVVRSNGRFIAVGIMIASAALQPPRSASALLALQGRRPRQERLLL